jgi:hypothetical protein
MLKRADAALASMSKAPVFMAMFASVTIAPPLLPLGKCLQHGLEVEHSQPAGADAGQPARISFPPQPGRRKAGPFRQFMHRE